MENHASSNYKFSIKFYVKSGNMLVDQAITEGLTDNRTHEITSD